jgi:hypothetical protein
VREWKEGKMKQTLCNEECSRNACCARKKMQEALQYCAMKTAKGIEFFHRGLSAWLHKDLVEHGKTSATIYIVPCYV